MSIQEWQLPYESPLPGDPRQRRWAKAARVAGYVVVLGAVLTGVIQHEYQVVRNLREAEAFDAKYGRLSATQQAERGLKRPKDRAGALARWRRAVQDFWAGQDIYRPFDPNAPDSQRPWLHPNMPLVVILLTPLAQLSQPAMAAVVNLLKVLVLAASVLLAVRVADPGRRRMPDWIVLLALLYVLLPVIADIRHGNTNLFVLGAIALHLWLYRRGSDLWAGAALAAAICLKMTPALFALYWLYQRNWRLLAGMAATLAVMAVGIPAAVLGWPRFAALTASWLDNLIFSGLKGAWYPIHVNQSLPAVLGRYLLGDGQPGGNIFWNPDDNPYSLQGQFQWIAVASFSPQAVQWIIRICQAVVVAVTAWAIGWRKLPRDDGRRGLHYGLVAAGILILNQRTWDHHACILLVGYLAAWQAVAFGRMGPGVRGVILAMLVLAGPMWVVPGAAGLAGRMGGASSRQAGQWVNVAEAYGPGLAHFLLVWGAMAAAALAMRAGDDAYAARRQRLRPAAQA